MIASQLHLKHLRLIAAIAQHRQVSLAADALGMTQPAASRNCFRRAPSTPSMDKLAWLGGANMRN